MKRIQKSAALLAVLALLFAPWTPVGVSAAQATPTTTAVTPQADDLFYFGRSALSKMPNGDALCYAYDRLVEGCKTISNSIDISHRTHRITSAEASLVYEAVANDHPAFFWLAAGFRIQASNKVVTAILPKVYDGIAAQQAALNARVAELTADLGGKSDYEKSRILHDRIAKITDYQSATNDQTVIGSLLQGKAVCAGYARGYQMLMQAVGIPTFVVTGTSKGQDHAWNLVQLDGKWYYTDVTWDDQGSQLFYAYLNLTYNRMAEDHVATGFADYLPRSTATAANYHILNGTAMSRPSADVITALYEAGKTIRLYMTNDCNAFLNAVNPCIAEVVDRIACPYSGYSYSSSMLGRELILNLTVTKPHTYDKNGRVCTQCGFVRDGGDALLGDANGNGKVNNKDLGLLQQYLNEWSVTIDLVAADLNHDGRVNNKDLGLLQQLLNH